MAEPAHNQLIEDGAQQPPQPDLEGQRPFRFLEDSSNAESSMDEADHNLATRILLNVEANSEPYVMSRQTMQTLGFDIRI